MLRIFLLFFALLFSYEVLAAEAVSTDQIIHQIEKSLLFDKDAREKIDVYNYAKKPKKSTEALDGGNVEEVKSASDIDIVVVNPKDGVLGLREKEKLAYNATLVSQYEVAVELYKKVIAAEPNNDYAKFALAVTYQKMGQLKQAKNIYYELLKKDPDNSEEIVENLLAVLIEESPKEASYILSRLATQNPSSANVLAQAALAYDKTRNYDKAISLLENAVDLSPDRLDYKYNLAVIYDKAEKYENALEMYGQVEKAYSDQDRSVSIDDVRNRILFLKTRV